MFRAIASDAFAPFGPLRLELPPVQDKPADVAEVHLFTGVNGTGKTRLLCVLSGLLGNGAHLQRRMKDAQPVIFYATDSFTSFVHPPPGFKGWANATASAGGVFWGSGGVRLLNWCQQVPAFAYGGHAYVSDAPVTAMGPVHRPDRNYCLAFNRPEDSSKVLLQAITNLLFEAAVDSLHEEPANSPHGRAARLVKSLESALLQITGRKFQFKIEQYPQISLHAVWGGTKLPFDVLPDGLRGIIGWLVHSLVMMDVWLQGKEEPGNAEAVFLLDEIESHLHPAWQRKILPAFQRLFPKAQIFVATHSPFVIASLNHGWIHSLKMESNGTVTIDKPKAASKGDSYISVVEEIMGIKEWFDPETENLLAEFRKKRDAACSPSLAPADTDQAYEQARQLGLQIGQRSMELDFMMGKELNQLDRQRAKVLAKA